MKKIILYLCLFNGLITFCSCEGMRIKKVEPQINTKEIETNKNEQQKIDSFTKQEENKVIGGIKFYMNKSETQRLIEKFKKENSRTVNGRPYKNTVIGNFVVAHIREEYQNDSLYEVEVMGDYIDWEKYDDESYRQVEELTSILSEKYGPPQKEFTHPLRHDTEKGYEYNVKQWVIGNKVIQIKISAKGSLYHAVVLRIYDKSVKESVQQNEQAKTDSLTKQAKGIF